MRKLLFFAAFILAFGAIKAQDLINWYIATSAVTAQQDSTLVNEGNYSAKVTWTSTSNQDIFSDKFAVTPDSSYTYSLDVFDDDTFGRVRLVIAFNDGSNYYSNVYSVDTAGYKTYQITGTVPTGADSAQIKLRFYDQNGFTPGSATIWVDNAIFTQGGGNLILDGGFENWTTPQAPENHMVDAAYYDLTMMGGTESAVALMQDSVTSIDYTNFTLYPDNITFGGYILPDSNLVALQTPSGSINNDNQLDTLIYSLYPDTAIFYAGILPVNYLNTSDPNLIQDGYNVTIEGYVTANDNYNQFWVSDDTLPGHGVLIFDNNQELINDLEVGDFVQLVGKRTTYNGATEIIPTGADSIGTTTVNPKVIPAGNIDFSLGQDDATAEPWEGQLVQLKNMTIFDYNSSYHEYTVVSETGDTVIVDDDADYHFNNTGTLNIGTAYDITGVVTFAYGQYKLNPRDSNDVVEVVNPSVSMIAAVGLPDTSIAIVYDNDITPDLGQIVLHQGNNLGDIHFSSYQQVDQGAYLLLGGDGTIANDNYVDTVYDSANMTGMEFYAGVLPVAYLNKVNSDTIDKVHNATFTGVVSAKDSTIAIWIQDGAGEFNGVKIYHDGTADDSLFTLVEGDSLFVNGFRGEYNDMTELLGGILIPYVDSAEVSGHDVYSSVVPAANLDMHLTANDLTAEPWEGQLVTVENVVVDSMNSYYEYVCYTATGDTILTNDEIDYHYGSGLTMDPDSMYNITGIVTFNYGQYKINPRGTYDIELVPSVNIAENNSLVKVYPNPASDYVRISGDVSNVEVYNVYGQRINVQFSNGTLNISGLATGVYSLRITLENGQIQNSKIIKK